MSHTVIFKTSESLSEDGAEKLFEELRTLSGVTQVSRMHDKKHTDLYSYCYLWADSPEACTEVMTLIHKDDRVEEAYVPAPRYLIAPVSED
jgi:hypothetical protein